MKLDCRMLLAAAVIGGLGAAVLGEGPAAMPANAGTATQPAADQRAKPDAGADRYLFEDQIHPGMKGYGLTVMNGGKIEKFQVEVIDVVKNFSPGNNAILVRCSGLGLEHSGIIAGMSGSPVYLQDKMIGAVAFGWGMAKDPIAGVQPIRQMLAIPLPKPGNEAPKPQAGGARWAGDGPFALQAAKLPGWGALTASLGKRAGGKIRSAVARTPSRQPLEMHALASPIMVSGLSASSFKLLAQGLEGTGLVPMESGSGTASLEPGEKGLGGIAGLKPGEIQLVPGAAIAIPLVTGDLDLSAIGTVTEVHDGKVYAFGHAFLAQGGTKLPMATSYIYTVMPNVSQSFKMGTSLAAAGTLEMDEQTGIVGKIGAAPPTVPVTVSINDGDGKPKLYHYQMSPHPKLTPLILNAVMNETLVAQRNLPSQFTARVTGQVTFAGTGGGEPVKVKIDNLGATDSFKPANSLLPILVLADNPFENLQMTALNLEATIEPTNRSGAIRCVNIDRATVAPGDEIHAVAQIERFQKDVIEVPIAIKIPADAADGDYELSIGNSDMALMNEAEYAPQHFDPQDIGALEDAVNHIEAYQPDHIYAALVMDISGASAAGQERRDLPASRVAIYASSRRTDASPVMRVVKQDADAGTVLENGGQTFTIHVNRKADNRYFSAKSLDNHASGSSHTNHLPLTNPAGDSSNQGDGNGDAPGP